MNDPVKHYSTLVSLFLMLATIAGGYVSLRKSPQANRPAPDHSTRPALAGENADASRLWEDPFWALTTLKDKGESSYPHYQPDRIRRSIEERLARGKSLLAMPVLIEGTPFPEDVEVRLRMRYAVQMALAAKGYTPENRTRIELAVFPWPAAQPPLSNTSSNAASAAARQLWVPYEWFVRHEDAASESPNNILVLWVAEEHAADFPISRIEHLLAKIQPESAKTMRLTNRPTAAVIGPRSSNTLKAFLENAARPQSFPGSDPNASKDVENFWGRLQLYSSQATAADWFLTKPAASTNSQPSQRPQPRQNVRAALTNRLDFRHLGATDDQLTDLLVLELRARGIDAADPQGGAIALICEADTTYGRALPLTFLDSLLRERKARKGGANSPPHIPVVDPARFDEATNVLVFRYLRGLDGHRGDAPKGRESAELSLSPEKALLATLQPRGERSEGEAQYDYIETLARSLARLNEDLADSGKTRVRAIGIMGSDVYDKLILLQALHLQLPEVLFFTTDLDRRFWNPDRYPFTRNLVIASGHGLSPMLDSKEHAFELADFRDSYQVSVFRACRAALTYAPSRKEPEAHFRSNPALYEIGRRSPVSLASDEELDNPLLALSRRTLLAIAGIAAAALFVALRSPDVRRFIEIAHSPGTPPQPHRPPQAKRTKASRKEQKPDADPPADRNGAESAAADIARLTSRHHRFIVCTLLASVLASACILWLCSRISALPWEEPWSFHESVSVWPTQLVRLATASTMALILIHAHFRSRRDAIQLDIDYFGGRLHREANVFEGSGRAEWLRLAGSKQHPPPTGASDIFSAYLRLAALPARLRRALILTAVFSISATGILALLGGFPERLFIRGFFSRLIDHGLLWPTLLVFTFLVAYITDAVRLTSLVLRRLAQAQSQWPENTALTPPAGVHLSTAQLDGWFDVLFARDLTAGVSKLLPLPFVSLLLLMLACNDHFDDWNWPPRLLTLVGLCLSVAIACVGWLRASARYVRANALREIDRQSEIARNQLPPSTSAAAAPAPATPLAPAQVEARLAQIRKKIEEINDGAYARLLQDPSILAVLLPTGGLGIITVLLQYLF